MKIGCDIAKIEKFIKTEDNFLQKYFTANEVEYIKSKNVKHQPQTIAGLFCAKEAFLKAVALGMGNGVKLVDIEITHEQSGKPQISYHGKTDEISSHQFDVSISHDDDIAMAVVVAY